MKRLFLIALMIVVVSTLFGGTASKKVIIDSDMGRDDILSILYLMKKPNVEIIGVTVTGCGETYLKDGVENALKLMTLGKQKADVYIGAATPTHYEHHFPASFKKDMSDILESNAKFPAPDRPVSSKKAWDYIHDTLETTEEKITILSLGGFTNLAMMLEKYPETRVDKIENIYAMAGAVFVDGNVASLNNAKKEWAQGPIYSTNKYAEYNVFVDPVAAKQIIDSDIPMTIIPLDACNYVLLERSYFSEITAKDPIATTVRYIIMEKTGTSSETVPVPIYDPLATMIMAGGLKPNQINPLNLTVHTKDTMQDNRSGQTYVDSTSPGGLINVVQGLSEAGFKEDFSRVINSDF